LSIGVTGKNCTLITSAFKDIHFYVTEAEIHAGQVKILLYTSQCFSANIGSN